MTQKKLKLEYALEYAARGWRVMPLHNVVEGVCTCHKPGCKTPAKHPRIMEPLKQATTDVEAIRRWWDIWPDANVAVVTGAQSGCVVLDIDSKSNGIDTFKALLKQHGELTERVLAKTGSNGYHLYFSHPGGHWPNTQGGPNTPSPIGQGLDFRGDGGYVVAVGSEHASGRTYEWTAPPNGHLPVAPEWLLEKLRNRKSSTPTIADAEGQILEGNRHNTLRAWACQMRSRGMSKQAIKAAIMAENSTRFAEPKEEEEVNRLVDWVSKFQPGEVPHWKDVQEEKPPVVSSEPSRGLISVKDVKAELDDLYYKGARRGLSVGWPSLDELYSVHSGDLTIINAAPSAGKTTLGLNIVANMATSHDWKIAVCSTENKVHMMYADLASMIAGATYYGNFQDRMTEEEKAMVDAFMYDHFRMITASTDEPFTLPYVLSLAKEMGADGLIVDPFGALELAQRGNSNDSRIIRDMLHGTVQPFLKKEAMHMWLMVHTTKLPTDKEGDIQMPNPYNATDSAGFFNAADFLFGIRRPKSKGGMITELEVQKVRDRFSGKVGNCEFEFEVKTGRYLERGTLSGSVEEYEQMESEEGYAF
jgi:hypothetical protein